MKIVTAKEMRELDRLAIEERGMPGLELMENAGRGVAGIIQRDTAGRDLPVVAVIIGKGNNGGDGLVVARYLKKSGYRVKIFSLVDKKEMRGDPAVNLRRATGIEFETIKESGLETVLGKLASYGLLVDAIFGTGYKGAMKGLAAKLVDGLNGLGKRVYAIDIPSGLEADLGTVREPAVRAFCTVTLGLPKRAFFLPPALDYCGNLEVVSIGLPADALAAGTADLELMEESHLSLPVRRVGMHKGDAGRLLVIGASRGLTGAAALCARGASRCGTGLVEVGVPASLNDVLEVKLTEEMTVPLKDGGRGYHLGGSSKAALAKAEGVDALAMGPGLGRAADSGVLLRKIIKDYRGPLVVDADGLYHLGGALKSLKDRAGPAVLTPHAGEFSRLFGVPVRRVIEERWEAASPHAVENKAIVVLKGAYTAICDPGGKTYLSPFANPGLAKGGSGDVLCGIIGGLLAQGLPPLQASLSGVYLHGLCGELARQKLGERGMCPGDLVDLEAEGLKIMESSLS